MKLITLLALPSQEERFMIFEGRFSLRLLLTLREQGNCNDFVDIVVPLRVYLC